MPDPASLVLGILPLVVEVGKAYKSVYKKFKTFRHHSREVDRVLRKVNVQRQMFLQECQLLLRLVVPDAEELTAIMKPECDTLWIEESEEKLKGCLQGNYSCCVDVIVDIRQSLEEINASMETFDEISKQARKGEKIKDATRRLHNSVKITFEKTKYEKHIKELQEQNSNLRTLRSQLQELKPQYTQSSQSTAMRKQSISGFSTIREASAKLHDSLSSSWCCSDWTHSEHSIKLCLEAQRACNAVCLGIIICFENNMSNGLHTPVTLMQPIRYLTVEAILLNDSKEAVIAPNVTNGTAETNSAISKANVMNNIPQLSSLQNLPITTPTAEVCRPKKRVRFSVDAHALPPQPGCRSVANTDASIPSQRSQNVCQNLLNGACSPLSETARCPGLFETCHGSFKHIFHSSSSCLAGLDNTGISIPPKKTVCLQEAMKQPRDETISLSDQLRLARRIAKGFLQFHSTYWLSDQWGSGDLSFFNRGVDLSDQVFTTLHLERRLSLQLPTPGSSSDGSMEGVERDLPRSTIARLEAERYLYGISNMNLYSLGVTLLEVGYWTLFDPKDVVNIRRLVDTNQSRPPISLRYRDLVRKCLECDFGFGKDLAKESLQRAVYDNVVNEIEELIDLTERLDIRKE